MPRKRRAAYQVEDKGGSAKEWLNPKEASEYLSISRTTLYKLMDSGQLRYYSIRGVQRRRIRKADLDRLFEESGGPAE